MTDSLLLLRHSFLPFPLTAVASTPTSSWWGRPHGRHRRAGPRDLRGQGARRARCNPGWRTSPRAHIINQRAVEVLRDLGVEEDATQAGHPVGADGRHPVHHQPGRPRRSPGCRPGAPATPVRGLPAGQPLHDAGRSAAPDGTGDDQQRRQAGRGVSFNTEYLGHTQDEDGVTVRFRNRGPDTSSPNGPASCSAPTAPGHRSPRTRPGDLRRARPGRHRLRPVRRRPVPLRRAPAEHPALDHELPRRVRGDRHGPAPGRPTVGPVDRRLGFRPG